MCSTTHSVTRKEMASFLEVNFALCTRRGSQRAEFLKKVHKPPLRASVINFELNGFNASIWVPWSPSDPKKLWCTDRSIQIHKICVKKLHVCTYFILKSTLRFVNLFVNVSRVCGFAATLRSFQAKTSEIRSATNVPLLFLPLLRFAQWGKKLFESESKFSFLTFPTSF